MACSAPPHRLSHQPGRPARRGAEAPLISIVIPAFDRPNLLEHALASIAAQTASVPLEVVVCDDGRMARTRTVVRRFRGHGYRYLANPAWLGAVGNWNRCLRAASGTWVMVLHEDDMLYPWYLQCVLSHLKAGVSAVCTRTTRGPAPPHARPPADAARSECYEPGFFLKSSMTPFPGVLMRRDIALRLGGFDERWGPVADYEFWYRLSCTGRIEVVRAVGAFYRVAPGQWTERTWGRMLRLTHLLRLRIAREQFPGSPRLGRSLARFFTLSNARCYLRRFGAGPADLIRCVGFRRCLLSRVPSGWVWEALKFASRPAGGHPWLDQDAGRAPQIQQAG